MQSKTTKPAGAESAVTFDEFRASVRYLLVNDHGMPELVADEALESDDRYVRDSYGDGGLKRKQAIEVADELAIKPGGNSSWVRIADGTIVVEVNERVENYLKNLVGVGLYGQTPSDVAYTMLCRGIESLLSVASEPPSKRR